MMALVPKSFYAVVLEVLEELAVGLRSCRQCYAGCYAELEQHH